MAVAWIRQVASAPMHVVNPSGGALRRWPWAHASGPLLVPLLVSPLSDPSTGPGVRGGRRGGRPSGPSESGRAGVACWRPCALRFKLNSFWVSQKAALAGCPPGRSLWKSCPPDTCRMRHRLHGVPHGLSHDRHSQLALSADGYLRNLSSSWCRLCNSSCRQRGPPQNSRRAAMCQPCLLKAGLWREAATACAAYLLHCITSVAWFNCRGCVQAPATA